MKIKDSIVIIEDNLLGRKQSFVAQMHENNVFDVNALEELKIAINLIINEVVDSFLFAEIATKLFKIYAFILECIVYHFDPNDLFYIKNLPQNYSERLLGLKEVINDYFRRNV